ncbi:unnamed protein product [Dibothriocephalus latus]|uniref:Uncharacterized protein n=1 Tax=Dibothriocephalus latus TaxID=60516 RepID=A0A3P7NYG0_DIBLA|nr:unnamed protein product [Dibothriocephalus latus]
MPQKQPSTKVAVLYNRGYGKCRMSAWLARARKSKVKLTNEWKNSSAAIMVVYGPTVKNTAPLLSADGTTLFTEKTQILKRRAKHFQNVLNHSSTISDATIDRLPQVEINADLDTVVMHQTPPDDY